MSEDAVKPLVKVKAVRASQKDLWIRADRLAKET
jgi:hypothetical protein